MRQSSDQGNFVVATPGRSVCDDNARVLQMVHRLEFLALATRRGVPGVDWAHTRLNPALGLANYIAARSLSTFQGESFRFANHPRFDAWVKAQLVPGNHIISSYGYVNDCFKWVRENGGKTFLDGGNSHPANFWEILSEEHRIWKCVTPPVAEHHYERSMQMMEHVDYVLSPSNFVSQSFLTRGFRPEQILTNVYPVNLANFTPRTEPRAKDKPFRVICTGSLSLRKGTPYLLEAFRLILKKVPSARLLLTRAISDSIDPLMAQYADLPIDWSPSLPHPQLADRLRGADLFILPSLEEGLARTGLEALACGLPVIVTPNTGINELIQPGVNGTVVPIRDATAIAEAALEWWEKIQSGEASLTQSLLDAEIFSFAHFAKVFLGHLQHLPPGPYGRTTPGLLHTDSPTKKRSPILFKKGGDFVVATPARGPQEIYARALENNGYLRLHCHGTRHISEGVPVERNRANQAFGALGFVTGRFFETQRGESLRFRLNPMFDEWVKRQLLPGDNVISSYGYANECFRWAKANGGHAILDAGNSHPAQFWQLVADEHALRGCKYPPVALHHHLRALESANLADYVFAVSTYVRDSFLERGFPEDRILLLPRPVNSKYFFPSAESRPANRPFTIICTGMLNFRKGAAYLFEAFDIIHQKIPSVRFLLTDAIAESVRPLFRDHYRHLPIEWAPHLPQDELGDRLRTADLFMLLSLEEGMARTGVEALCCGLPVVVTSHTGINDLVTNGQNGEIVPLRDAESAADAALRIWEKIQGGWRYVPIDLQERLSVPNFEAKLIGFLRKNDLIRE